MIDFVLQLVVGGVAALDRLSALVGQSEVVRVEILPILVELVEADLVRRNVHELRIVGNELIEVHEKALIQLLLLQLLYALLELDLVSVFGDLLVLVHVVLLQLALHVELEGLDQILGQLLFVLGLLFLGRFS